MPHEVDLTGRENTSDSINEFELIERFFRRPTNKDSHVALGPGDDCALLAAGTGEQWAVSTDTLIEGVHFFANVDAAALGHKALAVNLSDLAACGATPRCFFLAIALPRVEERWLTDFSRGLYALADGHQCVLAGGDTTRTPSSVMITITVMGTVPSGRALLRSGAQAGDDIWVSDQLGDAALSLAFLRGEVDLADAEAEYVGARLQKPTPRVQLAQRLLGIASSAIDVSDGLVGDIRHVLRSSGVGAVIEWARVPRSTVLQRQPIKTQQRCALAGGDDYELLFTAPPHLRADVISAAAGTTPVTRIGVITAAADLAVLDEQGKRMETGIGAYDHFKQ
ncbi:MAG TPA: thiamine-phosphate kinase [Burkholderiaceae bacterium]|nr:thiamine-phosphate kinase [Burkholderiaceae bacterium]